MIAENHDRFPGRLFLFYDLAGRATSERLQGGVSWLNCKAEKLASIADEGGRNTDPGRWCGPRNYRRALGFDWVGAWDE